MRILDANCTAGIDELQNDPAGVLQELAQEAGPVISVGMVSGFACGFALKKAGKVAAVVRSRLRTSEQAPSKQPCKQEAPDPNCGCICAGAGWRLYGIARVSFAGHHYYQLGKDYGNIRAVRGREQ